METMLDLIVDPAAGTKTNTKKEYKVTERKSGKADEGGG